MSKSLKSLLSFVVYAAVLVGIVYFTPKILAKALGTPYPLAAITSSSMWPALKQGDMVMIKKVTPEGLKIGDIIVYKNEQGFTIHRIIKLNQNNLVTKGDANNVEDKPVDYKEVIGRVVNIGDKPFRIPFLGKIAILIRK